MYGHLVAANLFGEAYVVPANDAFDNMRECLGATSMSLPDAKDFIQSRSVVSPRTSSLTTKDSHEPSWNQKKWDPIFLQERLNVRDSRFIDIRKHLGPQRDIFDVFLEEDYSFRGPSWETEFLKTIMMRPRIKSVHSKAHTWWKTKSQAQRRCCVGLTAEELRSQLAKIDPSTNTTEHRRRLM